MYKTTIPILLILGIFAINSNSIYACSCDEKRTIRKDVKHSKSVVIGKVLSREEDYSAEINGVKRKIASFLLVIEYSYKGKFKNDTMEILTLNHTASCGYIFSVGEKYIVYNKRTPKSIKHLKLKKRNNSMQAQWTDLCTRTTQFNVDEDEKLKKLRRKRVNN